jgi:5'-3' exonuclease
VSISNRSATRPSVGIRRHDLTSLAVEHADLQGPAFRLDPGRRIDHTRPRMRLHLVDGTFELFRAHFSKRPDHKAPDGREAKATIGVAFSLIFLLEDEREQATHVAVAFDNPIRSFRNDLFPFYKTEEGVARELLDQFDLVERMTRALGISVWSMNEWEADDALATGAARFRHEVSEVRILSPDKDLGQCLRYPNVVQVDRIRNKLIDRAALLASRGIEPESVPDFLALVGDTADGIPGLPGIGEKTAAALLRRYVHLEDIPKRAADWEPQIRGAEKIAATLIERREDALLYKKLATLIEDVPLREGLGDLEWKGARRAEFEAICDELGAATLRGRPRRFLEA